MICQHAACHILLRIQTYLIEIFGRGVPSPLFFRLSFLLPLQQNLYRCEYIKNFRKTQRKRSKNRHFRWVSKSFRFVLSWFRLTWVYGSVSSSVSGVWPDAQWVRSRGDDVTSVVFGKIPGLGLPFSEKIAKKMGDNCYSGHKWLFRWRPPRNFCCKVTGIKDLVAKGTPS